MSYVVLHSHIEPGSSFHKDNMEVLIFIENIFKDSVNTEPADGLAPLGAKASAGIVMTKSSLSLSLYIYMYIYIYIWLAWF